VAGLLALLPHEASQGRASRQENAAVAQKLLGPCHQRWRMLQAQGVLQEEVTERVTLRRTKGAKPEVEPEEVLMLRHSLVPLGIGLDRRRIDGYLTRNKDEQVVEQFERLQGREPACEPKEAHLIGQAQAVVGPKTAGDLGVVCGGKLDAFSNYLAGVIAGLLHDDGRKEWDWTRHGR
jgi:hypothetical protein